MSLGHEDAAGLFAICEDLLRNDAERAATRDAFHSFKGGAVRTVKEFRFMCTLRCWHG